MRRLVTVTSGVALLLALALPVSAGGVNFAGGLMFTGETVSYTVGGSLQIVQSPNVYLDLLYGPPEGEVALGLAAPVRTALDPLAKLVGFEWTPWAEQALDRVCVGAAFWRTADKFPVRGGLYFRVTALQWGF